MARAVGKKGAQAVIEVAGEALVEECAALVRDRGAVALAKLPRWKQLGERAREQLVAALVARGLERGDPRTVRVPLVEQVAGLARGGARLPLKSAKKRVAGGSAAARDAALAEAIRGGSVRIVVRTKTDTLVGAREDVLEAAEIDALVKAHEDLGKVLKLVRKKIAARGPLGSARRTLLRDDAAALTARFSLAATPRGERGGLSSEGLDAVVVDRIRALERPPIPLVWVPDLVKSLSGILPAERTREALMEARNRGVVELRPESGVNRLTAEDAALCPRDAAGQPLSHVRVLGAR